tara:strand:+ start:29 stop:289 length:261 start_codon:yes stop_codon:yes gene_type:complete
VKKKKKNNQSTSYNIPIKFVFVGILLTSCSGWSIMGYSLDEEQENKLKVLSTITDNKGIEHFYNGAIHSGENWCYNHNQYETVEIK